MTNEDIFLKTLGKRINEIRKEKNLSFRELALRCEMEKSSLVKLANKGTNITMTTLYKVSKGLGVQYQKYLIFKLVISLEQTSLYSILFCQPLY